MTKSILSMDTNDVRKLIRSEIQQTSVVAFAQKAGVTRAQIYLVMNGQREPRGTILDLLGLEKFTGYRPKRTDGPIHDDDD
jgi:hypothetical protein